MTSVRNTTQRIKQITTLKKEKSNMGQNMRDKFTEPCGPHPSFRNKTVTFNI